MPAAQAVLTISPEDFLARLTTAAYGAALRHGLKGPFIDVELDIWRALHTVVHTALAAEDARSPQPDALPVRRPAARRAV